ALNNVGPVRKELGVKTFFNMLGPMVNPAMPKNQLVGVFSLELARLYGYLYQNTDKHYVILHALDGYDEVSLTGNFKMVMNEREEVFSPSDLGLKMVTQEEIHGGETVPDSAKIFEEILNNKATEAQRDVVLANAGLAIAVGKQIAIEDGIAQARESLKSGKALESFKHFLSINQ
ncbi:unnamed protein product, partial [Chrysoparadoxa australica]